MKCSIIILLLTVLFACAQKASDKKPDSTHELARESLEGSHYTAVQFERGKSSLSEANKKYLNELARKASRTGREIEEIKILAWSDHEYTPQKTETKTKTRDVILANERATVIRAFIRNDLHAEEHIDIFNMAKKPGFFDQLTKDEEFRVKQDVAMGGVSATRMPSGEASYTKAGKVLVIIDYKEVK